MRVLRDAFLAASLLATPCAAEAGHADRDRVTDARIARERGRLFDVMHREPVEEFAVRRGSVPLPTFGLAEEGSEPRRKEMEFPADMPLENRRNCLDIAKSIMKMTLVDPALRREYPGLSLGIVPSTDVWREISRIPGAPQRKDAKTPPLESFILHRTEDGERRVSTLYIDATILQGDPTFAMGMVVQFLHSAREHTHEEKGMTSGPERKILREIRIVRHSSGTLLILLGSLSVGHGSSPDAWTKNFMKRIGAVMQTFDDRHDHLMTELEELLKKREQQSLPQRMPGKP